MKFLSSGRFPDLTANVKGVMKRQFEKASLDLLTVVCRFSRLCCPAGEPATRLSKESRQMQVKEAILVIKGEWLT